MSYPTAEIPTDGRITSLTALTSGLVGSEVMEIVAPGNAEEGNNYQIALSVLAAFFSTSVGLQAYTVATLPTPTTGLIAYVIDGDAGLTWGDTVINSGPGATNYAVWYNGTAWTVFGK